MVVLVSAKNDGLIKKKKKKKKKKTKKKKKKKQADHWRCKRSPET